MRKTIISALFLYILSTTQLYSQGLDTIGAIRWADSVIKTMNEDQKIGQLFMVAAYSNRDSVHTKEITKLITNYHIKSCQPLPSIFLSVFDFFRDDALFKKN